MTQVEFDAWHEQYKIDNDYPLPGVNAATGRLDPTAAPTTAYVEPVVVVPDVDVRVPAFGEVAALGEPVAAPVVDDDGKIDLVATREADLVVAAEVAALAAAEPALSEPVQDPGVIDPAVKP